MRTDEEGRFRLAYKGWRPGDVTLQPGGLPLSDIRHATGNPTGLVFSPLVPSQFRVRDEAGKLRKLRIAVAHRMSTAMPVQSVLTPSGTLLLPSRVPLGFVSEDPKMRLVSVERRFDRKGAVYEFVARPDQASSEEQRDRRELKLSAEKRDRATLAQPK